MSEQERSAARIRHRTRGSAKLARPYWRLGAVVAALTVTVVVGTSANATVKTAPVAVVTPAEDDLVPTPSEVEAGQSSVPEATRDAALGDGWTSSGDTAFSAVGDAYAFNIYAARASDGYSWGRIASLRVVGVETDRWIGNFCLSEDGSKIAAVYAPRFVTNDEQMFNRGAFGAVVDVATGDVHDLGLGYSIAYFNPGCGSGSNAMFSAFSDVGESRLDMVDLTAGTLTSSRTTTTQLTSAIPTEEGVIAAAAGEVVKVDVDGKTQHVAEASGVPFDLTAVGSSIAYVDAEGETGRLRVADLDVKSQVDAVLATGVLTDIGISPGLHLTASVTGEPVVSEILPEGLKVVDAPVGALISSEAELAVTEIAPLSRAADGRFDPTVGDVPVSIAAKSLVSGQELSFSVDPGASTAPVNESGVLVEPADKNAAFRAATATTTSELAAVAAAGSPSNPIEAERTCAVARNDPGSQAMQPKPRQVEWAVNQAVLGQLNVDRPGGYLNVSTTSYKPQQLFPSLSLLGGGRVPSQVMLGIIAQESNMWQASRYAVPGVTGSPLIGNFYGLTDRDNAVNWSVNFTNADCGYGVAQVTDGMRLAGMENGGVAAMSTIKQRAVALDFAANIAAGLQILVGKWNETKGANLTINDGDPQYLENWFFAVWAYNSGFHAQNGTEPYGVGWMNNPINPNYPASRTPFLENRPSDASHPQDWPYPEKVMGFAAWGFDALESMNGENATYVSSFRPAWWTQESDRTAVKPPRALFCNSSNNCDTTKSVKPSDPDVATEPAGPCLHKNAAGQYDLECWFHVPATWKADCSSSCGHELLRFYSGYSYQADANSFPPNCSKAVTNAANPMSRGLPSGTVYLIDDVPNGTKQYRSSCTTQSTQGTFAFTFANASNGTYPSKIDTHQLGGGFNSHFYFAHTRQNGNGSNVNQTLNVTGKWTLNTTLNQWARVLVHLPDHGAWTQQAQYQVGLGNGTVKTRSVPQRTGAKS
ncbi:hypothetical protein [Rathayibacter sp. AY1A7]|uniref:hypothetical protein n=1 Tax=Rathayibacter sp. AY1A7 TaxID=2080524 RepID=UPI0011B069F1|nr:hypothetical protein [Rathayibacter sp. AY1A7]